MLLCIPIMGIDSAYAQANKTNQGDVVCPVAGSSIEVIPQRSARYSYAINNTSGLDIRISGSIVTPATTNLTASNSFLQKAGQPYTDSTPGILNNRIVCMSTTAATATISFFETYK